MDMNMDVYELDQAIKDMIARWRQRFITPMGEMDVIIVPEGVLPPGTDWLVVDTSKIKPKTLKLSCPDCTDTYECGPCYQYRTGGET